MKRQQIASTIDHTYLKLDGNETAIAKICLEAMKYQFASVALLPTAVPFAAKMLRGSGVKVDAALSFFRGRYPLAIKLMEVERAIADGAEELDLVISVSLAKEQRYDELAEEFQALTSIAGDLTTKVILETSLLEDPEKIRICQLARDCGIKFVKTSTGMKGGATVADVRLMRQAVGCQMGVKASGGIRTLEQTIELIDAGATRLGTSSGVEIVKSIEET